MFINNLSAEQQSIFLGLAKELVSADGRIDDRETRMISTLKNMCNSGVTPAPIGSLEILRDQFGDRASKVSMMLELVGVAHADQNYDVSEKQMIRNIAQSLDISGALLEDIENWVRRQMGLTKEANLLIGE